MNQHLTRTLENLGFTQLRYDKHVFVHRSGQKADCIVCVHVDDLLVVDINGNFKKRLVEGLTANYGKITTAEGTDLTYLGVQIQVEPGRIQLNQAKLIRALEYREATRRAGTPASQDILRKDDGTPARDPAAFRSTLMKILYVATKTRFDVLFATNVLAGRQHCCSAADEEHLTQLVKYLKETAAWNYVIQPKDSVLSISADASFACHTDGRGHTGFVCRVGGATVFARSVKQRLVA